MLTRKDPGVKLLDFGIAKASEVSRGDLGQTRTGMIVGTPEFIAPEQIERPLEVTAQSDVYTLGLVLFFMIANRLAFEPPGGAPAFLFAHIALAPPRLDEVAVGVPEDLVELVAKCLRKAPGERPGAEELAETLRRIADREKSPEATEIAARGEGESTFEPVSPSGTQTKEGLEAVTRLAVRPGSA
jgi:serine/threonine protein kinase